jgi:hypothetical protein
MLNSMLGNTARNSSPPQRATTVPLRTLVFNSRPSLRRTASPRDDHKCR